MASLPRILTVDNTGQIAEIIRGAMMLMDRRFILVEIPNADGALDELRNSHVNLLMTAFALPDSNGMELASRSLRESAGTPIIVLANPNDAESVDPEKVASLPYTYLVRPVGEQFLRALRIGLDGEAAVAAQEASPATSTAQQLGPIPEMNDAMLRDHILTMMRDTGSMGAFVADRLGRIVFAEGVTGYFDIEKCAATLGPHFAHTADIREMIGGNSWSLQYFDGDNYDLFGMSLGLHYFAVLIFDGTKRPQYGSVTNFGRKEADAISEAMGDEAWAYRRQISTVTQTVSAIKPPDEAPAEETEAVAEVQEEAPSAPKPAAPPAVAPELKLDPIDNLDVDTLFSQSVDENAFDELFSEDEFSQEHTFIADTHSVSFDEAMNMGILDE